MTAYRQQIDEAKAKILAVQRDKQRIDAELEAWIGIRERFETLAKTETTKPLLSDKIGPTEAIRIILGKHPAGLSPAQIRDELQDYGIAIGSEKNLMSNIHAIIKRHRDIEEVPEGGRKIYRLKTQGQS